MRFTKVSLKAGALAMAAITVACMPVISNRGYMPDREVEARIKAGTDTKTSVQERLGYASTTASFGADSWYYISQVEKQVAFFHPTVLRRQILAVYFDRDGKVTGLRHFTLKDGHVVAFESRETPARGREMTFLQQLLNATPSQGAQMQQQQTNPGNGGGPTNGGGIP